MLDMNPKTTKIYSKTAKKEPPGGGFLFGNFSRLRYMETFSTWTGLIHGKAIGIEQQKDCQQKNLGHHKHIHHKRAFPFVSFNMDFW